MSSERARPGSVTRVPITSVSDGAGTSRTETVVTEEPLEIRLRWGDQTKTLGVILRTPGADFELVAGFLLAEGVIAGRDDVIRIEYCGEDEQRYNVVTAVLWTVRALPERLLPVTSACGVCGSASLDALADRGLTVLPPGPGVRAEVLLGLPEKLRSAQKLFDQTGGLHAAGLFAPDGELLAAREDVGRHNAVDKVVGWALLDQRLPLSGYVLLVSGRAGYEIAQKALAARIPVVCAVSAPSSLAVDLASRFGLTLVGFLRGDTFNVYAGETRIAR